MAPGPDLLPRLLGANAEHSPFTAEQIVIDLTSGLRGAEVGLRSFRHRPLLRRLWEAISGTGQERLTAVGADLLAVQRATFSLVKRVMAEELRTQVCVNLALRNLQEVNTDLDAVQGRIGAFAGELAELRSDFAAAAQELQAQLCELGQRLDRERAVRRLSDLYQANVLHPGAGPVLASALYLAYVRRMFAGVVGERQEWATARHVVASRFQGVQSLPVLLLDTAEQVQPEAREEMVYLCRAGEGPVLAALRLALERRGAELSLDRQAAEEALALARHWQDPERWLSAGIRRPREWIVKISQELDQALPEGGE